MIKDYKLDDHNHVKEKWFFFNTNILTMSITTKLQMNSFIFFPKDHVSQENKWYF